VHAEVQVYHVDGSTCMNHPNYDRSAGCMRQRVNKKFHRVPQQCAYWNWWWSKNKMHCWHWLTVLLNTEFVIVPDYFAPGSLVYQLHSLHTQLKMSRSW